MHDLSAIASSALERRAAPLLGSEMSPSNDDGEEEGGDTQGP